MCNTLVTATQDPDPKVAAAASDGLYRRTDENSVQARLALLKHTSPEVRVRACLDLQQLVRDDVTEAMLRATHDGDPRVRAAAAIALIWPLREGLHAEVQEAPPAIVARLKEMLSEADPEVRGRAAAALGETCDPTHAPLLLGRLGPQPLPGEEERAMVSALAMLFSRDMTGAARTALQGYVPRLVLSLRANANNRWAVIPLLRMAGTAEARTALEEVAKSNPDADVRGLAAAELREWDKGSTR